MGRTKRALVIVAFTLVSCSSQIVPAATPTTNTALLRLYTTTAALPLANELTTTYSQRFPTVAFDVVTANYGSFLEHVAEEEDSYFLTNHLPTESALLGFPIGQDGIAVIVHPDNLVTDLTTSQIRDIYQGRITNWADVGGRDRPIDVVTRESGSGTRAEFERLVMGDRQTTRNAQVAPSSTAMVISISRLGGGIGFVSMSYLNTSVRPVSVNTINPTLENVYDNSYPLRATLFITGMKEPEGAYRAFIGWVQSPEGQTVVARNYAPMLQP
jgi:phosphate transport system substrate-binding protein